MLRFVSRDFQVLALRCTICVLLGATSSAQAKKQKESDREKHSLELEYDRKVAEVRYLAQSNPEGPNKSLDHPKEVYSLDQLVKRLKTNNFSIRKNAEKVYRARKQIGIETGRLLPSLNFLSVGAILTNNYVGLAATLLGFLYPSNWFVWKESKYEYEMERWSYMNLVANQVNSLLDLVYQINKIRSLRDMYVQYRERLTALLEQANRRLELSEDRLDQKIKIENIYLLLTADQETVEASIRKMYYQLAFVVGIPTDEWNTYEIEASPLSDLENIEKKNGTAFQKDVHLRSLELGQLKRLFAARKYTGKSRQFNFSKPTASSEFALGFGYSSMMQFGLSLYRELLVVRQETSFNLDISLFQAIEDHNVSIENFPRIARGLKNGQDWYDLLETQFFLGGEYEAQDFLDALISLFKFHAAMIDLQYQYLGSLAVYDRLLLNGDFYKNLDEQIPERPHQCLDLREFLRNLGRKKPRRGRGSSQKLSAKPDKHRSEQGTSYSSQ